jgi:hypothetical protein
MKVIRNISPHWMMIFGFSVFPVDFVVVVIVAPFVVVVVVVVVIKNFRSSNKERTCLAMVKLLHIGRLHV